MQFKDNAEDQAINGREFDLGAEKAAHYSPEEFWEAKAEVEDPEEEENENRHIWTRLDCDPYDFLIYKNHFVWKLKLPKNLALKDYKREISFFSLFLRKFGKFIFKHEVLNKQYKHSADNALKEAWDNYLDSDLESQ